jgi:hypothetical protein
MPSLLSIKKLNYPTIRLIVLKFQNYFKESVAISKKHPIFRPNVHGFPVIRLIWRKTANWRPTSILSNSPDASWREFRSWPPVLCDWYQINKRPSRLDGSISIYRPCPCMYWLAWAGILIRMNCCHRGPLLNLALETKYLWNEGIDSVWYFEMPKQRMNRRTDCDRCRPRVRLRIISLTKEMNCQRLEKMTNQLDHNFPFLLGTHIKFRGCMMKTSAGKLQKVFWQVEIWS